MNHFASKIDSFLNHIFQVTLLFNNAGIMPCKPLLAHSEKEVEKVERKILKRFHFCNLFSIQVFAVNVFSQFWCIYEFLPRMLTLNMVKNSSIMMDNIDTLAI